MSIPHSQGPVRPERPALAPQRWRRGARAAQQRRTARWHRTMPVKGGWEGAGEGGGGEAAAAENIVADGVEGHEVRVDLALPVGYRQDIPSDGQI